MLVARGPDTMLLASLARRPQGKGTCNVSSAPTGEVELDDEQHAMTEMFKSWSKQHAIMHAAVASGSSTR